MGVGGVVWERGQGPSAPGPLSQKLFATVSRGRIPLRASQIPLPPASFCDYNQAVRLGWFWPPIHPRGAV